MFLQYLPSLSYVVVFYNVNGFVVGHNQDTPERILFSHQEKDEVWTWLSSPGSTIRAYTLNHNALPERRHPFHGNRNHQRSDLTKAKRLLYEIDKVIMIYTILILFHNKDSFVDETTKIHSIRFLLLQKINFQCRHQG